MKPGTKVILFGVLCLFVFLIGLKIMDINPTLGAPVIIASLLMLYLFIITAKRTAILVTYGNVRDTCTMKHVSGLPLAANVKCTIRSYPDSFEFSSGSMKFVLEKSKITDVSIKTDWGIRKQYVSSAGGAVAGGMLFGPLGALIGGRTKNKASIEANGYLIITYISDEIKYIAFNVGFKMTTAKKFVREFKRNASDTTINL